ncbi:MAG: hypothetical protein AB7P07_08675 [Hyphomonadaceae bacterium]
MRFGLALFALAIACAPAAMAQGPLPSPIVSSRLSQAQEEELNRRLAALQGRFNALAGETQLREAAVRNIAVEIFGAQPDLDFETYAGLIDNGARELRTLLTEARARSESDPEASALRAQAIAAAEDGRLSEARGLYDQLIARTTETLEARWAQEDAAREAERNAQRLEVAADMAEAARLAFVAADYLDAARRYGEAAERAPEGARERWEYYVAQGDALRERGDRFGERAALHSALGVYQDRALPLASPERARMEWGDTQARIGRVHFVFAENGVDGAVESAIAAFRAATDALPRQDAPDLWAAAVDDLGNVVLRRGWVAADEAAIAEAISLYRLALEVRTRDRNPNGWAETQQNLGLALYLAGRGEGGESQSLIASAQAFDAALSVYSREANPLEWARVHNNLSLTLTEVGRITGDVRMLHLAVASSERASELWSREVAPRYWVKAQINLGGALSTLGDYGDDGARVRAIETFESLLSVVRREDSPLEWAGIQHNLGLVHRGAVMRGDRSQIPQAEAALTAALGTYEQLAATALAGQVRAVLAELENLQ